LRKQIKLGSDCLYACGFRIYCTPLPGFFSPFPHGTGSLSVDHEYLALEDGPPIFRQDFTCPALLLVTLVPHSNFRLRGCHPLRPPFPGRSANSCANSNRLFPFRSPLLGESRLISLPAVTEMFQFSAFALPDLWIQSEVTLAGRVSPFGHLRIKAHLPAPRSLTQAITSFFACDRQGIHHMHLLSLDPITLSASLARYKFQVFAASKRSRARNDRYNQTQIHRDLISHNEPLLLPIC